MAENVSLQNEMILDPDGTPSPSTYCSISLKMILRPYQEHILDRRFEVARKLYNSLLGIELKKYRALKRTEEYRAIQAEIDTVLDDYSKETQEEMNPEEDAPAVMRKLDLGYKSDARYKEALKKRKVLLQENGFLGMYSFQKDLAPLKNYYESRMVEGKKKNNPKIGAQVLNVLAIDAWKSISGHIYKGTKVLFVRKGELNSLSSTNTHSPMTLWDDVFTWHGFTCPVELHPNNPYEEEMLRKERVFYRVVRKTENLKNNYYVQVVLKGAPVRKRYTRSGNYKHLISPDVVGVDVGLTCVAAVSDRKVALFPLAPHAQSGSEIKEDLQAFLSRSRFLNNPHRFLSNGTIRRLPKKSKERYWNESKAYRITRARIREIDRYNAAVRKDDHGHLSNTILSIGSIITMEKIAFQKLAERAKETEITSSGRIKSKKRGGGKIGNCAPAMFVSMLERKAVDFAGSPIRYVDPKISRVSRYDHTINKYLTSRPYDENMTILSNGDRVETHLYNAFLLNCLECDTINHDQCLIKYEGFKRLHDQEFR